MTLPLVDTSRPTVSHGQVLARSRTLTTEVWYPTHPGPSPLIMFAHGYQVGVTPYRRICALWASAGYIVAAPEFPLTDQAIAGSHLDENDKANQPADVSFVITTILALSTGSSTTSQLHGLVSGNEVAVAGHSDGADTALADAYLPTDRDPRVRAVIADGADPLPGIGTSTPLHSDIPLLLVHGTADTIVPFADSDTITGQLKTPGWFLQLLGADHLPPIAGPSPWTAILDQATTDFFNMELKGAPSATLASAVAPSPIAHLADLTH
jgi:predicted dienelactone hydrolase